MAEGPQGGGAREPVIEILEVEGFDAATGQMVPIDLAADAPSGPSPARARLEGRDDGFREALREILPALDALEACFRDAEDQKTLEQGVRMALRALWDVFRARDLERIEGDGVPFDPGEHEAVEVTPTGRVGPNTVLEVLRVGYKLGGHLVRPAMVRVSGPPHLEGFDPEGEEERG